MSGKKRGRSQAPPFFKASTSCYGQVTVTGTVTVVNCRPSLIVKVTCPPAIVPEFWRVMVTGTPGAGLVGFAVRMDGLLTPMFRVLAGVTVVTPPLVELVPPPSAMMFVFAPQVSNGIGLGVTVIGILVTVVVAGRDCVPNLLWNVTDVAWPCESLMAITAGSTQPPTIETSKPPPL